MAFEDDQDFRRFLSKFEPNVQEIALGMREFVWRRYPQSNELIYDKKNGLSVGWGFTDKAGDIFVSFACYSKHVNFGFHHGNLLTDPQKMLSGSGSQYRHIKVSRWAEFPSAAMEGFAQAAWLNVHGMLNPTAKLIQGVTIVKSI